MIRIGWIEVDRKRCIYISNIIPSDENTAAYCQLKTL